MILEELRREALRLGAFRAEILDVKRISLDASFRTLCISNACGNYGKNYMCPPDIGPIEERMEELKRFERVLVYQTVRQLEDSYDFEGMLEAGRLHNELASKLRQRTEEGKEEGERFLHLGAGGCRACRICAKQSGEPCRKPGEAMSSLEAYGVNVSLLAREAGMDYVNGVDTVTYFGCIFRAVSGGKSENGGNRK